MALLGSLMDIGIIDLLQFPHTGRKTGVLVVASPDDSARLHYLDGKLVHAITADVSGQDVLTEIVGWTEGEFEFRTNTAPSEEHTIHADLHRAIMQALKVAGALQAEIVIM